MRQISELLEHLKQDNNVRSYFLLGYLYEMGKLVPQDFQRAYFFYKQAAEFDAYSLDNEETGYKILAAYNIWVMQISGHITPKNQSKSPRWVLWAEEYKMDHLLCRIGLMYEFGSEFEQDYKKAYKYYELARSTFPYANIRLGLMHELGLGCRRDLKKAKELYQYAETNGYEQASIFLRNDLFTLWPNEGWIALDEAPNIAPSYRTSSGMQKLSELIASWESGSLFNPLRPPSDIEMWLLTIVPTGIANNTCSIGKHYLDILNHFFNQNSYYLSDTMLMMPLYARSSATVETYVKFYLRAKAWLMRAKKANSSEADNSLQVLATHKDRVEVTCRIIYEKFIQNVEADEKVWQKALKLIKQDQAELKEELINISTIPNTHINIIDGAINESNIDEYAMWCSLIMDDEERKRMHIKFFDAAVNSDNISMAVEFVEEFDFDVNYLIKDKSISPLEFFIIKNRLTAVDVLLARGSVDVNFNTPIFIAVANNNVQAVKIILEHPLLDLSIKRNINGSLLSVEEAVNASTNVEIRQLVRKCIDTKKKELSNPALNKKYIEQRLRTPVEIAPSIPPPTQAVPMERQRSMPTVVEPAVIEKQRPVPTEPIDDLDIVLDGSFTSFVTIIQKMHAKIYAKNLSNISFESLVGKELELASINFVCAILNTIEDFNGNEITFRFADS